MECDSFEIVRRSEAFKALQYDWEDLCGRSSRYRFSQSFVWCWTTWEVVHEPRKRHLHCIIARNGGRPVLIWPLVIYRSSFPSLAAPLVCFGEYPDPLVEEGPEAGLRIKAAWRTLRETCGCDLIRLRHVREGSELHRLMIGERAKIVSKVTNLQVDWNRHDNWESYYRTLRKGDRREIERRRRRLDELGNVTFEVIEGSQCEQVIDWALANKVEQLVRTNRRGGNWLRTKAYRNLLVWAASRSGPCGRVVTLTLKLDGRLIATQWCRVDEARVEHLNTVYDPAYSKFGPGTILRGECLKWAFEHHLEVDMKGGDYHHKRRWANRESRSITYDVAISTSYALGLRFPAMRPLIHSYRAARRKLGKRLPRWLKHTVSPPTT
jgi:CelD/BcsL family acetyltransferase involved in cellulose biosynthesis